MRRLIVSLLVPFVAVAALHAQDDEEKCKDPLKIRDCTVLEVHDRFRDLTVRDAELHAALSAARLALGLPASPAAQAAAASSGTTLTPTERAENAVGNELRTANVAATPPATSGAQIHVSRRNFNIPAALAINSVERDKQALVIQFNKIDAGPFGIGATGTIKQPTLFGTLRKAIPEAQRAAVSENLEEMLRETDDISLALLFTPATPECTTNRLERGACYGRDVRAYRPVLSPMFRQLLAPTIEGFTSGAVANLFSGDFSAKLDTKVKDLSATEQQRLFDYLEVMRFALDTDTRLVTKARKELRLDENLAKLIENQPQWTLSLVGRQRDVLAGANEQGLELAYERGRVNLNSVRAACKNDTNCFAKTISDKFPSDSFTFTLGVTQTDHYEMLALPEGASEEEVEFGADGNGLDVPRVRKYLAQLQYGVDIGNAGFTDDPMRLDLAAKWEQRSGNPEEEFDTRLVIAATLSIPLGEQITLPLTLSYANHEDLLEDRQKNLGMHFGLTYRLPFKKPE
jgi:hypothetical protein